MSTNDENRLSHKDTKSQRRNLVPWRLCGYFRMCLAFVLTGSESRQGIAAGVSQWLAVRSIREARRADTSVPRLRRPGFFFTSSTRSRARLFPAASSTLNTYFAFFLRFD